MFLNDVSRPVSQACETGPSRARVSTAVEIVPKIVIKVPMPPPFSLPPYLCVTVTQLQCDVLLVVTVRDRDIASRLSGNDLGAASR